LLKRHRERYASDIATAVEIERLALTLTEKERATLAANLLESLPGVLSDDDEGIAEALRRDAEIEANPNQAISLTQLNAHIKSRRR
jgi:putative addiction module component (TIGR02574 family)